MLPIIEQPLFKMVIPSTKKEVMVRPMLVKEEKILLMAKEGDDYAEKLLAVKQVVNNCCQNINVDDLTIFDIEYLFLKIRAISVDSKVKLTYRDDEDGEEREFEIDLDKVEVDFSEKVDNVIMLNDKAGFTLRYPTSKLFDASTKISNEEDFMNALMINAMVNYFDGDQMFDLTKETPENMIRFIEENINSNVYYKIREFLSKTPSLKHEIKYKNNEGNEKTVTLTTLNDFFMF